MLLGHWVELEWLESMEMQTRTTRIGSLVIPAFPVVPVALAVCHLADVAAWAISRQPWAREQARHASSRLASR